MRILVKIIATDLGARIHTGFVPIGPAHAPLLTLWAPIVNRNYPLTSRFWGVRP